MINVDKLMKLKNVPRTGWLLRDVPQSVAESVAEHTFEVALNSYVICKELLKLGFNVELSKVLVMALLHDSEEAVIGDVIRYVKERVKDLNSIKAELLNELGLNEEATIIREYTGLESYEGVIVKISDILATANQACRYERIGYDEVNEIIRGCVSDLSKVINLINNPELREALTKITSELLICNK